MEYQNYISELAKSVLTIAHKGDLSRWEGVISNSQNDQFRKRIVCIGDSITRGLGSNPDKLNNDIERYSWPSVLSSKLSKNLGIPASGHSIWGNGLLDDDLNLGLANSDPRIKLTQDWRTYKSVFSVGGYPFKNSSKFGIASEVIFEPNIFLRSGPTDSMSIYTFGDISRCQLNIFSLDDQSINVRYFYGGDLISSITAKRALQSQAGWGLKISNDHESSEIKILGMEAFSSEGAFIQVDNFGASGSTVDTWSREGFSIVGDVVNTLKPQLALICLTVNDSASNTKYGDYYRSLNILLDKIADVCDIIMLSGNPVNSDSASIDSQALIAKCVKDVALARNITYLDFYARWVSQSFHPERDLYFDGVHPSVKGHHDIGNYVAEFISRADLFK